ncbi:hypothetical protein RirG_105850 [Rhizophagus irregularis DAOM 197198w]|uniref:Uncharacterized protein n=1 Tax=Rhizophagus irregularis (strain DAOM 197198w) TaxID=1432141 RepID=A0A015MNH5_RHIIW|nr:hypothetical protein RirG_105850 [Rhizophagus irregularis DAOM 197198w]
MINSGISSDILGFAPSKKKPKDDIHVLESSEAQKPRHRRQRRPVILVQSGLGPDYLFNITRM